MKTKNALACACRKSQGSSLPSPAARMAVEQAKRFWAPRAAGPRTKICPGRTNC